MDNLLCAFMFYLILYIYPNYTSTSIYNLQVDHVHLFFNSQLHLFLSIKVMMLNIKTINWRPIF